MEDSKQFCENCKRDISEKNFELHYTHCKRNIKFCELCNEPISTNRFKAHLDEDHAMESCLNCKIPLEKWMLPQHQKSCQKRLVSCEFCEAEIYYNKYVEHKEFCGSRTEKCVLCQKYIMLKDKEAHSLVHLSPKEIPREKENISQDVEQNSDNQYNSKFHLSVPNKFSQKSNISEDAKKAMQYSEMTENLPEMSEAFKKHYGICHICKKYVAWVDMNLHIPTCASDAGKCSQCGKDVPDGGIKEHMQKYCSKLSETASPKRYSSDAKQTKRNENIHSYCVDDEKSEIPESRHSMKDAASLHTKPECYDNHIYEEIFDAGRPITDVVSLQSKPKHSGDHENTEFRHSISSATSLHIKPDTNYLCPICHMYFSRAEIKTHVYSCNADSKKCDCGEDVPRNEIQNHICYTDQINYDSVVAERSHDISIKGVFEASSKSCPYCYQKYSADHISDHIKNCPENFFECALCGDKLSKEERGIHEGFYCKALLDIFPPNSSCVPTFAESLKNTTGLRDTGSMSWDEDAICPICHNRVSISGLEEHSLLCKSRIKPCKFCQQDVQIEYERYHLMVCPVVLDQKSSFTYNPYDYKKGAVYKNKKSLMKTCDFCKITYNLTIMPYHIEECGKRPIECDYCGKKLKLKNLESHISSYCSKYPDNERKKESRTTSKDKKPSTFQMVKNWFVLGYDVQHGSQDYRPASMHKPFTSEYSSYLKYSDTDLIPCEFCGKKFPFENIIEHTTGCDPELVSKLKKNPLSCEGKSENFANPRSFFKEKETSSVAVTKQPRNGIQQLGSEPEEFVSCPTKEKDCERKYQESTVKSYWGGTGDCSELSSDEDTPEHAKDKKDEDMQPYSASIKKQNPAHHYSHSEISSLSFNEENKSKSESSVEYPYSTSRMNQGSNTELNSDFLDQDLPALRKDAEQEKIHWETVSMKESNTKITDYQHHTDIVQDRKSLQERVNERELSGIHKVLYDIKSGDNTAYFATQTQEDKKNKVSDNKQHVVDVSEMDKFGFKYSESVKFLDAKELSGIHKVLYDIKSGDNTAYFATQTQEDKKNKVSDNKQHVVDVSEMDKFGFKYSESVKFLDAKGSETQSDKRGSKTKRDEQELHKEAEFSVHEARYSNISKNDFVEINNESSSSKFGAIGQDRNIHDKFRSSEVFENSESDILLNKQGRETKVDKNVSSLSKSVEYYQKLQSFSFKAPENEGLQSSEVRIEHDNCSTEVSAKDYVNIYSQVNKLSAEYLTVQHGQKDENKGYVSVLTLGDERYMSFPESATKELSEELAAKKAMAAIKERIRDISRSSKELESREPDILQEKQHSELHRNNIKSSHGFSSQNYQKNQNHSKNYPESEELQKDKDVRSIRESSDKDMSGSSKACESKEGDLLSRKHAFKMEMHVNKPFSMSSVKDHEKHLSSTAPKDERLDKSRNKVSIGDNNEGEKKFSFKIEPDNLRSYKTSENKESEIDANLFNKNSANDYEQVKDKQNQIDSREFLVQGRNRGYENPAFNAESGTNVQKQNMAQDKTYDEIIDGMKESLIRARLALGGSDDRTRDMDTMISEHEKRVAMWKKYRDPEEQDSEEDL